MFCYSFCTSKPGWLLCDGSEYLVSDYPDLFAVIGYMFVPTDDPDADGNHFRVPNCKGKFLQMVPEGKDHGILGEEKQAGLPNITGTLGFGGSVARSGAFATEPNNTCGSYGGGDTCGANYFTNFDASRSSSIYGNSTTVQPPSILVNYFIKY